MGNSGGGRARKLPGQGQHQRKGEKIYHVPWSKHYPATRIDTSKGGCWFCSEAEARGGRLAGALSIKVYLLNLAVLVTDFPLQ